MLIDLLRSDRPPPAAKVAPDGDEPAPDGDESDDDESEAAQPPPGESEKGMIEDAVLVVDKPSGITSFDVVREGASRGACPPGWPRRHARPSRLRRASDLRRRGDEAHPVLLDADKAYEVTIRLGVETDTDDADGTVTVSADASAVDEPAVRAALVGFRGPQRQVPPVYSALKREGRPLYAYARAGTPIRIAEAPGGGGARPTIWFEFVGPDEVVLTGGALFEGDVRAVAGPRPRPGVGGRCSRRGPAPHSVGTVRARGGPSDSLTCWTPCRSSACERRSPSSRSPPRWRLPSGPAAVSDEAPGMSAGGWRVRWGASRRPLRRATPGSVSSTWRRAGRCGRAAPGAGR